MMCSLVFHMYDSISNVLKCIVCGVLYWIVNFKEPDLNLWILITIKQWIWAFWYFQ